MARHRGEPLRADQHGDGQRGDPRQVPVRPCATRSCLRHLRLPRRAPAGPRTAAGPGGPICRPGGRRRLGRTARSGGPEPPPHRPNGGGGGSHRAGAAGIGTAGAWHGGRRGRAPGGRGVRHQEDAAVRHRGTRRVAAHGPAKVRRTPATRGGCDPHRTAGPSVQDRSWSPARRKGPGTSAETPVRARGPWSRSAMPHGPPGRGRVRRCSTRRPRRGDGVPPAAVRRSGERGPYRVSCAVRTPR